MDRVHEHGAPSAEHPFDVAPADDPFLDQPCVRFGLPDEAAYACEVIDRLRATASDLGAVGVPRAGLALAAPQIGILRTAALIRPRGGREIVLLNPYVVEESVEETSEHEDCLGCVDAGALVRRPKVIDVEHQDPDGSWHLSPFRTGTARLVSHGIEHLHGRRCAAQAVDLTKPPPRHGLDG